MLIGYARTSTIDQEAGLDAQLRELEVMKCSKIFHEKVSSVQIRKQLEAALDYLREGDTLVTTKLDRLARSVTHLGQILEIIQKKKAHLKILDINIDTSSATGELVLNLLGSIAQFERKIMLERQREGIAKAKTDGKYKGRKATAREKASEVLLLKGAGERPADIAKKLKLGRASVYRILQSQST
jgi:DNA invertase Pin-like site-specific DNA recombinase